MIRKLAVFVLAILFPSCIVRAQEDPVNSIGLGGLYAVVGYYTYVEYEHFISDNHSFGGRAGLIGYSYEDDEYTEDGSGLGVGAFYRWYFGQKPMGGFFVGIGAEFASTTWDYNDFYTGEGSGSSVSLAPTGQIGGRFNLGSSFFIAPSLVTGYFIAVSGDSESELGFFGGPNVVVGFRF